METTAVFFWFAGSVMAGVIADRKGRSGAGFFILSLALSPLIGIFSALVARPDQERIEERQVKSGERRACPACAELIRPSALKCMHCGADISPAKPEVFAPPIPSVSAYRAGKALGRLFRRA